VVFGLFTMVEWLVRKYYHRLKEESGKQSLRRLLDGNLKRLASLIVFSNPIKAS
jgi:hypothetical protein